MLPCCRHHTWVARSSVPSPAPYTTPPNSEISCIWALFFNAWLPAGKVIITGTSSSPGSLTEIFQITFLLYALTNPSPSKSHLPLLKLIYQLQRLLQTDPHGCASALLVDDVVPWKRYFTLSPFRLFLVRGYTTQRTLPGQLFVTELFPTHFTDWAAEAQPKMRKSLNFLVCSLPGLLPAWSKAVDQKTGNLSSLSVFFSPIRRSSKIKPRKLILSDSDELEFVRILFCLAFKDFHARQAPSPPLHTHRPAPFSSPFVPLPTSSLSPTPPSIHTSSPQSQVSVNSRKSHFFIPMSKPFPLHGKLHVSYPNLRSLKHPVRTPPCSTKHCANLSLFVS